MPIHRAEITADSITIWRKATSNPITFQLSDLPSNLKNKPNTQKAEFITGILQNALDSRQLLTSLPTDDPDRTTDPAQPNMFWATSTDGNTYLVGRSTLVTVAGSADGFLVSSRRV